MTKRTSSHAVLPADWTEILQRVQQTLAQADVEAAQRVTALEPAAEAGISRTPAWRDALEQLQTRLDALSTFTDRATSLIGEADVALGAGEDMLQGWLQASEAARRKLAAWVNGAIG
jgi:hypothetical protein